MRWINHQTTTAFIVYAATGNLSAASIATIGSVVPDAIEFPFGGLLKHRGITHWPYLYFAAAGGTWYLWHVKQELAFYYVLMFVLGMIIHLLEDALSPRGLHWGMPDGQRKGLGLYVPFKQSEYVLAYTIIGTAMLYIWFAGYSDINYLTGEIERIRLICEYFGRRLT